MNISERAGSIQASPIRKLAPHAIRARENGKSIYHLNIGQPDIPTPVNFWDAVRSNMGTVLSYGPSIGIPALREAICEYYSRGEIELAPDEIMITTGGSEAVLFALMTVANPGDEVICFEPFYTNYNGFATLAGINLVPITSLAENGYHLPSRSDIIAKITERTRAILICNPNNPTGTILTEDELGLLASLAEEKDIYLLSDEVYRDFTFDGRKHISLLEFPDISDRVVVMDSISKRFSSCGARLGNLVTRNRKLMEVFVKFGQARLCPPTLAQYGAAEMYTSLSVGYYADLAATYQARRDIVMEVLQDIDGIFFLKPEGAFYATIKLPITDTDAFAAWMLTDFSVDGETVMVAPAAGFYASKGLGLDEIRIAYVLNETKMRRSLAILKSGIAEYK